MPENKTKATALSVTAFLDEVPDEGRRADAKALLKLMQSATGEKPKMWGPSIVGFGSYHYKYDSGREGDWLVTGFSPRKKDLTLYIMMGFEKHADLMEKLGKHSHSKSCLYIKRLSDVHIPTLKKLIKIGLKDLREYTKSQTKA